MTTAEARPSPQGEALAAELRWMHDMIRRDLRTVRQLAADVAAGRPAPEVEAGLRSLAASGPLWQLKVNCLRYRFVRSHHHGESTMLFPSTSWKLTIGASPGCLTRSGPQPGHSASGGSALRAAHQRTAEPERGPAGAPRRHHSGQRDQVRSVSEICSPTGQAPAALGEAIGIIRASWSGEPHSHEGSYHDAPHIQRGP